MYGDLEIDWGLEVWQGLDDPEEMWPDYGEYDERNRRAKNNIRPFLKTHSDQSKNERQNHRIRIPRR